MELLRYAMDVVYNNTGHLTCFPLTGSGQEEAVQNIRGINFELSWIYLSCSQFFFPIDGGEMASSFYHFNNVFNKEGYWNYCKSKFGVTPPDLPIFLPNELKLASNIVFSNMGLFKGEYFVSLNIYLGFDPVHTISVVNDTLPNGIGTVFLPDGAHTVDLLFPDSQDTPGTVDARKKELEIIHGWLKK